MDDTLVAMDISTAAPAQFVTQGRKRTTTTIEHCHLVTKVPRETRAMDPLAMTATPTPDDVASGGRCADVSVCALPDADTNPTRSRIENCFSEPSTIVRARRDRVEDWEREDLSLCVQSTRRAQKAHRCLELARSCALYWGASTEFANWRGSWT